MPTTYTPNPNNALATVALPADGDADSAITFAVPYQQIGDGVLYNTARAGGNTLASMRVSKTTTPVYRGMAFDSAAGSNYYLASGTTGASHGAWAWSLDGETWTEQADTVAGEFLGIAIGKTGSTPIFMFVGDDGAGAGVIKTTTVGSITVVSPLSPAGSPTRFYGAAYAEAIGASGNGRFVVVGAGGKINTTDVSAPTCVSRTAAAGYTGDFYAACWTGTQFIISGTGGEIQKSADGITWTRVSNTAGDGIRKTIYAPGAPLFLPSDIYVGGDNGVINYTNNGGTSWSKVTLPGAFEITTIIGLPGAVAAIVYDGTALSSMWMSFDRGATWPQWSAINGNGGRFGGSGGGGACNDVQKDAAGGGAHFGKAVCVGAAGQAFMASRRVPV